MIKKEFIDKCANYCRTKKGAEVLHAESVRKINDKRSGKKKRVVVITNQFITYFKEQKDVKPDHFHYWRNVSSFDILDQTVIIKFEKDSQLRFIHPNVEEVKSTLIQFFLRTFSSEELGPLDLSHFPHPPIGVNGRGILSRFDTLFRMENKDPKIPAREFFEDFLLKRSKFVNFDESLEIDDVLNCILEALRPLPYIQYISLPKIVDSNLLYEALTQFVSKNSEVKMLALRNNADENSTGFFNALSNSPVSQLKGLTFEDVELSNEELNKIHDLSVTRQFSSASFINCIHQPVLDTFSTDYLSNDIMAKLRYLSLDKTVGINLSILSKRIQALSVLSIAHCELEISDVLEAFGNANLENLRFLNLSGNMMNRSTNAQIPPNLERLHVSNVTWGAGIFPKFLKYFLSQTFSFGLKFNCSSAQGIPENDWETISDLFNELDNYPLEELSWSYNKVSKSLFKYLTKNPKLTTLFLSNCFDVEQDLQIYQVFCKQLPNMKKLANLVIYGSEGLELREQSSELFEALKQNTCLSLLIINGNKIKDDGIKNISQLITSNKTLNTISFDSSYITTIDVLRELIEAGNSRNRPLHVSWPVHDLNRLLQANSINKDELDSLKKYFTVLSTGRGKISTEAQFLQAINIAEQQKQMATSQRNARNRGSVRIGRKQNQASLSKDSKKDQGRKIRAGSLRGLSRPNLLSTEKSPTEEDPNLWVNEPFDMFFTDFTDNFPLFLTDNVNRYFEKNPLGGDEATDGKKHRHHSSKHSSHHHHHSKHHSSKHSSHHHHHHSKNDNEEDNENENEKEIENDSENLNVEKNPSDDEEGSVKTRDIQLDAVNDQDEDENENEDSDERLKEEKRQKRDREVRQKLEREEQEEREKEEKRLRRQKDRETRDKLDKEAQEEREIENERKERERKRKEDEIKEREMDERRERGKEVNDRRLDDRTVKTRDAPLSNQKPKQQRRERASQNDNPQLKKLNSLFDDIVLIDSIEPPKNMFLYVDPYGRPLQESVSSEEGNLIPFDPPAIDLINMAPPPLSEEISAQTKPQPKRSWPNTIDRSSLDLDDGEYIAINVNKLILEDFPDFDEDIDEDEDELEKVDPIVLHRRERQDNGELQLPEKRFPIFPLLNVENGKDNDSNVLPIDWNFQLSQVTKLGNYKFYHNSTKPLEQLVDELEKDIRKDSPE